MHIATEPSLLRSTPSAGSRPSTLAAADNTLRYCVIGAGAAGLAVARSLASRRIPFDVLERHSDVGGIWDMSNERSPMYESAHFISSKTLSGFSEHPFPDHVAEYPSRRDVLELIRSYAERYDLRRHVRFGVDVAAIERLSHGWSVRLAGGESQRYRGVILASGFQWTPNLPTYPGMGAFAGRSMHSIAYRTADVFDGKRVLIVGCGASGIDIASDAAHRARSVVLSMRRGHHFLPKHVFGKPLDVWAKSGGLPLPWQLKQFLFERIVRSIQGDLTRYGLERPDHRILERPPIVNSHIVDHLSHGRVRPKPDVEAIDRDGATFVDGTRESFDIIVYCTGYTECWPTLDERHLRTTGEGDLFLKVLHKRYDDLFVAGLLRANEGGYALLERQGELIARAIGCDDAARHRLRRLKTTMRDTPRYGIPYKRNPYQSEYFDADGYRARIRSLERKMRWS